MSGEAGSLEEGFRFGMRRLAGGVTAVATRHGTKDYVSTMTSVCSLSMDPPSLIVCINRTSSIHDPLQASGNLSVNVLSAAQVDVAKRCSGFNGEEGDERFAGATWKHSDIGIPFLQGALATFICRVKEQWNGGTHSVFSCLVEEVRLGDQAVPLAYAERAYCALEPLS